MSKKRSDYTRISKTKRDRIIELSKEYTLDKSADIMGVKPKSLKRRVEEMRQFYNINVEFVNDKKQTGLPKVLLFDIETTPIGVMVWGLFGNNYINHQNILFDWHILSWSGKWLFGDKVFGGVCTPEEAIAKDDKRIITMLWEKMNEADIIIAHNGDKFDVKKSNTRFIINGLLPPNPYKTIDTLNISKKYFSFTSNRLDYISRLVERKGKLSTDFQLWVKCMAGDRESLDYMYEYNQEDVRLLEDVYLELRPWIKSHPNMSLYVESDEKLGQFGCANCGKAHNANDVVWTGVYSTNVSQFKTFRCDCGAIVRTRKSHKISPLVSPVN